MKQKSSEQLNQGQGSEEVCSAQQQPLHKRLGAEMDLFHFPEFAPGFASWHPKGMVIWNALAEMWRESIERWGYEEVRGPMAASSDLWQRSGHWQKYSELMFKSDLGGREAAFKPMNCPAHADIYSSRPRSWRELPIRMAEMGHVHRSELSGAVNGLLRARSFVIDDAHIFCAPEQVAEEINRCLSLAREVYGLFGMSPEAELSLRPDDRIGDEGLWDEAEKGLRDALHAAKMEYSESPGEGAFYGPKIDLHVSDSLGRKWQLGSVQLDYQLPERFDLRYAPAEQNRLPREKWPRPVVVHRAVFGSFERFIAILLEHFDGRLPLWLSPEQVRVMPIGEDQHDAAAEAFEAFEAAGLRASLAEDGGLGERIARAHEDRCPVSVIIGRREADAGSVVLRRGKAQKELALEEALEELEDEIKQRRLPS